MLIIVVFTHYIRCVRIEILINQEFTEGSNSTDENLLGVRELYYRHS